MAKDLISIMLVEDEVDIQEVARLSLETIGKYDVTICSTGKEALEKVTNIKPDLIILDMMMPGMDGLTTLKLLREKPDSKDIPVIFMTAKAQTSEMKNYISHGALGAISKPFDPMHLSQEIAAIWNLQK